MHIYLATDHAGFELKNHVLAYLQDEGFNITDLGNTRLDVHDDYPDWITKAAQGVAADPDNTRAIIFGGSGQGEAMMANRFNDVRAAVFYGAQAPWGKAASDQSSTDDPFAIVRLSRQHNNANILSIGARFVQLDMAIEAVRIWLAEPFDGASRNIRRIAKIDQLSQ